MRRFLFLFVVAAGIALLLTRAEPFGPRVEMAAPFERVGRASLLRFVARDRGSGLASIQVRLVGPSGAPVVVGEQVFPRRSWVGSDVPERAFSTNVDAHVAGVPEGPATLEIWVHDHSWLDVPVFRLDELPAGWDTKGPALLESATTTVLVREGERLAVTPHGWLDIRIG